MTTPELIARAQELLDGMREPDQMLMARLDSLNELDLVLEALRWETAEGLE
jgi:hypothetical protein